LPLHAIEPEVFRPLTVAEYERMHELGMFDNEAVELVYGSIVRMSPIGPSHAHSVTALNRLLVLKLDGRADIRPGVPLAAGEISLPQPDLAAVPIANDRSLHPDYAFLLVEVSKTSLAFDRRVKRKLYAEIGVPEYWIVNLVASVIEVYDLPEDGRYTRTTTYAAGESIRIGAFPDVVIAVDDVIV
jgi:Uma2 family endonuclease